MKACPTSVWQHPAWQEDQRTWADDSHSAEKFANNLDPDNASLEELRCPAGVTGCCGVFKRRSPYAVFPRLAHNRIANKSNPQKESDHMKIKPAFKSGGVLMELRPAESQIPAQSLAAAP